MITMITPPGGDGDQAATASNRDVAIKPERECKGAGAGKSPVRCQNFDNNPDRVPECWKTKQIFTQPK